MKITFDAEVDALYIRFLDAPVTTRHVADGIAVDYAAKGRIADIEILDAKKRFGDPEALHRFVSEDIAFATRKREKLTRRINKACEAPPDEEDRAFFRLAASSVAKWAKDEK